MLAPDFFVDSYYGCWRELEKSSSTVTSTEVYNVFSPEEKSRSL